MRTVWLQVVIAHQTAGVKTACVRTVEVAPENLPMLVGMCGYHCRRVIDLVLA